MSKNKIPLIDRFGVTTLKQDNNFVSVIFAMLTICSMVYGESTLKQKNKIYNLHTTKGLVVLDHQLISISRTKSLDLIGLHYLHQLNNWGYFGTGLHAPMFHGNYGGFMTFDITIHLQHKLFKNMFVGLFPKD